MGTDKRTYNEPVSPSAIFADAMKQYECAVDPAAEAERMRGNQSLRDTFSMTRRIPADRFDAYLSEFVREVSATEEAHYGTRAFRSHFLNWSEKRYRIAKDQAATTTTATRSTIPQAIRVYE